MYPFPLEFDWSHDYGFVIYVAETPLDDYASYAKECEALGFNTRKRSDETNDIRFHMDKYNLHSSGTLGQLDSGEWNLNSHPSVHYRVRAAGRLGLSLISTTLYFLSRDVLAGISAFFGSF